jgi:hypothetical protein
MVDQSGSRAAASKEGTISSTPYQLPGAYRLFVRGSRETTAGLAVIPSKPR